MCLIPSLFNSGLSKSLESYRIKGEACEAKRLEGLEDRSDHSCTRNLLEKFKERTKEIRLGGLRREFVSWPTVNQERPLSLSAVRNSFSHCSLPVNLSADRLLRKNQHSHCCLSTTVYSTFYS